MVQELARRRRAAVPGEIIRARGDEGTDRRQLAADEARILKDPDADRRIEAVLDEIDEAVAEGHVERDAGILLGKLGERGPEMDDAE